MVTNRTLGLSGLAGAAMGGIGLGLLGQRRAEGARRLIDDPEWVELHRTVRFRVTAFATRVLDEAA